MTQNPMHPSAFHLVSLLLFPLGIEQPTPRIPSSGQQRPEASHSHWPSLKPTVMCARPCQKTSAESRSSPYRVESLRPELPDGNSIPADGLGSPHPSATLDIMSPRPYHRRRPVVKTCPGVKPPRPRSQAFRQATQRKRRTATVRSASATISQPGVPSSRKSASYDRRRPGQAPPTLLARAGVVEDHMPADRHEAMPGGPVELAAPLGVVAVDEHQVHRALPAGGRVMGERDVPAHLRRLCTAPTAARASARRVAHSVAPQPPGSASGCEPNGSIRCSSASGPERLEQRQRRRPLVYADLHRPPGAPRSVEQHANVLVRVHRRAAVSRPTPPPARAGGRRRAYAPGVRLRSAWGRIATQPPYVPAREHAGQSPSSRSIRAHGADRAQTAETCSSSATRNEEPQPHAATTLGLLTLKPAPCRLSS